MTFGMTTALSVAVLFSINARKWSEFFIKANDFSVFGKPKSFESTVKQMNMLSKLYFLCTSVGFGVYTCASLREAWGCKKPNKTNTMREICGTFVPISFPVDIEIGSVLKWSIFVYQCSVLLLITTPAAHVCYLSVEATEILITHLNHLKEKLNNTVQDNTKSSLTKIRHCVRYHVYIIR